MPTSLVMNQQRVVKPRSRKVDQPQITAIPPFDVLHYLFSNFFKDVDDSFRTSLSSINRHWRSCALESPSLWSSITIHCHGHDSSHDFALLALERSRLVPIQIRLHASRAIYRSEVSKLFTPNLDRVTSIFVYTHRWSEAAIWQRLDAPMPSLTHVESVVDNQCLAAYCADNDTFYEKNWTSTFLVTRSIDNPSTRSLPCSRMTPFQFSHTFWSSLNATSLTTLILRGMPYMPSIEDLLALLSNNTSTLTTLELWDFQAFLSSPLGQPPSITLHALETLKVGYNSTGGAIFPYFENLFTPNLLSLTLQDVGRCSFPGGRPYLKPLFPDFHHSGFCPEDGRLLLTHFSHCNKLRIVSICGLWCQFLNDSPGNFMRKIKDTVEELEIREAGVVLDDFMSACAKEGLHFAKVGKFNIT